MLHQTPMIITNDGFFAIFKLLRANLVSKVILKMKLLHSSCSFSSQACCEMKTAMAKQRTLHCLLLVAAAQHMEPIETPFHAHPNNRPIEDVFS